MTEHDPTPPGSGGGPRDLRFSKDPWEHSPTEELADQVLPRWFVVLALLAIVAAIATLAAAFGAFGRSETPVATRRPPPPAASSPYILTHDVGAYELGGNEPVAYDEACNLLEGVQVAGTPSDRASLRRGLAAVCNVAPDITAGSDMANGSDLTDGQVADALRSFAEAGGIVRFAAFETTGVDSAATTSANPPQILVNARFSRADPLLIAPLIAHDVVARGAPGDAETELAARAAEADACARLFGEPPRSCADARTLVASPDPLTALRDAGYE